MSVQYVLQTNASAYVPRRLLQEHVDSGRLSVATDAPTLRLTAYAVYATGDDDDSRRSIVDAISMYTRELNENGASPG